MEAGGRKKEDKWRVRGQGGRDGVMGRRKNAGMKSSADGGMEKRRNRGMEKRRNGERRRRMAAWRIRIGTMKKEKEG
jgi:hypothetical protein